MRDFIEVARRFIGFIVEINGFPLSRKIGAYALVIAGFLIAIPSAIFCLLFGWAIISGIFDGSIFPNIDPDSTEWDIR
ncbi:hypothetical protein [Paenibacillus harenae]|uniref:hypothetical protein n=1 Tax=Paenibacillus harenae TaxID=306543 RepID=UPI00278CDD6D|nr:hypothetical protein [Paenibacillus harenae]MDQ0062394.1 hypothetical protein [Paenibacillus harenae]